MSRYRSRRFRSHREYKVGTEVEHWRNYWNGVVVVEKDEYRVVIYWFTTKRAVTYETNSDAIRVKRNENSIPIEDGCVVEARDCDLHGKRLPAGNYEVEAFDPSTMYGIKVRDTDGKLVEMSAAHVKAIPSASKEEKKVILFEGPFLRPILSRGITED